MYWPACFPGSSWQCALGICRPSTSLLGNRSSFGTTLTCQPHVIFHRGECETEHSCVIVVDSWVLGASRWFELYHTLLALPTFIVCDRASVVCDVLESLGFSWDGPGFQLFFPIFKGQMFDANYEITQALVRLLLILSDDRVETLKANGWMPSPEALAYYERDHFDFRENSIASTISLGARAYYKLGRYDDAVETATIGISPEQQCARKTTLVDCHLILGKVAADHGQMEVAGGHFAHALEEADTSGLPLLSILAARDWKKFVLEKTGQDCAPADTVISEASKRMGKSVHHFDVLLV